MKMRALAIENVNEVKIKEVDIPELKSDEILVKVVYSGICGTDLSFFTGETDFVREGLVKYPVRIGHEWSGIVEKIGTGVTKFKAGDRVISDNGIVCRECEACKKGDFDNCVDIKSVGTINCWDGSFAEYIVIPECHLFHIPDNVSLKSAALVEPAGIAMGGIIKTDITKDTTVMVIGTGAIGLSAIALAKNAGAKSVIMVGRTKMKLDVAEKMGADYLINTNECDTVQEVMKITDGKGVDLILETSGAKDNIQLSIDCAAKRGIIALIGFYETVLDNIIIDRLVTKEACIVGVMGGFGMPLVVLKAMENNPEMFDEVITEIVSLDEAVSVFENSKATGKQRIKALVKISDDPDEK